jgi:hypothetical protein
MASAAAMAFESTTYEERKSEEKRETVESSAATISLVDPSGAKERPKAATTLEAAAEPNEPEKFTDLYRSEKMEPRFIKTEDRSSSENDQLTGTRVGAKKVAESPSRMARALKTREDLDQGVVRRWCATAS